MLRCKICGDEISISEYRCHNGKCANCDYKTSKVGEQGK